MRTTLRRIILLTALLLAALLLTPSLHAAASSSHPQVNSPESILLIAANRDRVAIGLAPFQWDANLAAAARLHAQRMAQRSALSHQFPGEQPLQVRAMEAGARFSLIAENVAEGPTPQGLHAQWMNSPPHRANLLDRDLNSIGIAVVQSGNLLFAVQDFSVGVPQLSLEEQESQVSSQLSARGMRVVDATLDARKTCEMDRGWAGQKPFAVMRYETSDLGTLPEDIDQKLRTGKYHSAAVGACEAAGSMSFTRFRIAILLY
ncbi:MAG TPA: CAP domain-containing protein [Candidatus Acidoferrum sp.]|nr:CAP domain-containing protein [Candidatus Acidoferrum sp.]